MTPTTMTTTNTGAMVEVLMGEEGNAASRDASGDPQRNRSVSDEVYERNREGSSSHRIAFDVAQLGRRRNGDVRG